MRVKQLQFVSGPFAYSAVFVNHRTWWRKLLVRLFSKYVAQIIIAEPKCVEVTIDTEKVFDSIRRGVWEFTRWSGKKCEYIIVGRDMFDKIMVEGHQYLRHEVVVDSNDVYSIFGCILIIAPFIEGMIFLPDITKGRR